jgi:hypothetical protein
VSDTPSTWISLREAQFLLDRSEGSVRRLLKQHPIRTRKVFSLRGRELRVCREDLLSLLTEAADPREPRTLVPDAGLPVGVVPRRSESTAITPVQEVVGEFQIALKTVGQALERHRETLEKIHAGKRTEDQSLVETQRQITDCLTSIHRTAKAQTVALQQLDQRLREERGIRLERSWVTLTRVAVVGLVAGTGILLGMFWQAEINQLKQRAASDESTRDRDWGDRQAQFTRLEDRLNAMAASLDSVESERAPEARLGETRKAIQDLRAALEAEMVQLQRRHDAELQSIQESHRARSLELNHIQNRILDLERKMGERSPSR